MRQQSVIRCVLVDVSFNANECPFGASHLLSGHGARKMSFVSRQMPPITHPLPLNDPLLHFHLLNLRLVSFNANECPVGASACVPVSLDQRSYTGDSLSDGATLAALVRRKRASSLCLSLCPC